MAWWGSFRWPDGGRFQPPGCRKSLPCSRRYKSFTGHKLSLFSRHSGYPYFVQEWDYQVWNLAATSPITKRVVRDATATVIRRLDENFFRVRFDRLTPSERNFLRAMAALGPGPQRTGDIASKLGVKVTSLGPVRSKLIKKGGMIYSPAHGDLEFTVPLFDQFMIRAIPQFKV
ncbi:MAG TPA: hypothetical protein VKE74_16035 [Gemmataceae bacterium]|nr:hypothetical protein [Gemmataceae bacterium]